MSIRKAIGTSASKAGKIQPTKFQFSGTKGTLLNKSTAATKAIQNANKSASALQKVRQNVIKDMKKIPKK